MTEHEAKTKWCDMYFIKPEALDILAEQILIAAWSGVDEQGRRVPPPPGIMPKAPCAAVAALDALLGDGGWAPAEPWPKPEQMDIIHKPSGLWFP